jgi:hypothetical protein
LLSTRTQGRRTSRPPKAVAAPRPFCPRHRCRIPYRALLHPSLQSSSSPRSRRRSARPRRRPNAPQTSLRQNRCPPHCIDPRTRIGRMKLDTFTSCVVSQAELRRELIIRVWEWIPSNHFATVSGCHPQHLVFLMSTGWPYDHDMRRGRDVRHGRRVTTRPARRLSQRVSLATEAARQQAQLLLWVMGGGSAQRTYASAQPQ